jgi:predicted DNA-binding transcriptional regulator AlpA
MTLENQISTENTSVKAKIEEQMKGSSRQVALYKPGDFLDLLTTEQVSKALDVTINTLQIWRHKGKGPRYIKLSRRAIRYRKEDILEWLENSIIEAGI